MYEDVEEEEEEEEEGEGEEECAAAEGRGEAFWRCFPAAATAAVRDGALG